mgnify:CR=1 FL=1
MIKIWHDDAWDNYLTWQANKKLLTRINKLVKDIERNGYEGIGNPEPLKYEWSGYWSREIDEKNRLIYRIVGDTIEIVFCGDHYGDK